MNLRMGGQNGRAVVDTLSRQCRDNRDFRDCRQAITAVSTENIYLKPPLSPKCHLKKHVICPFQPLLGA